MDRLHHHRHTLRLEGLLEKVGDLARHAFLHLEPPRKYVDEAFATLQMSAHVVAEIESVATLNAAIAAGLGATVLPESAARATAWSS